MKTYNSEVSLGGNRLAGCTIHMSERCVWVSMYNGSKRTNVGIVPFTLYKYHRMTGDERKYLYDIFGVANDSLLYDHLEQILNIESELPPINYVKDRDGQVVKGLPVLYREERVLVYWTLRDILDYINSKANVDEWQDYNRSDWVEGWRHMVECEDTYHIEPAYLNQDYFKY